MPTITVVFTPEFGIRLIAGNVDLTHLWAASAYLQRVADQAHMDRHMAAMAQSAARPPRASSGLVVPMRDHLPKRRV